MSLHNPALRLSEEAQDLILDHIRSASQPRAALRDFGAFCLVSRHWLSSGRRALYREPLRASFNRTRARAFIASLESNDALGRNVRNLRRLAAVTSVFSKTASSEAWEFATRVLAACPFVTTVTLPFTKYARLVKKDQLPHVDFSRRPLRSFAIALTPNAGFTAGDLLDWIEAQHLANSSIERFRIKGLELPYDDEQTVADCVPSLPLRLRGIVFERCDFLGSNLIRLLPIKIDCLKSLTLCSELTSQIAARLVELCGATLQVLALLGPCAPYSLPHLFEYEEFSEVFFPSTLLAPLPRLRVLRLRGVSDITISALRDLVKSNKGHLIKIDLEYSLWSFEPPNEVPEVAFDLCLPSLADLISSLPDTCKKVHLGTFPFFGQRNTLALTDAAKRKGIELTFSRCCDVPNEDGDCDCEQCS